jgi:hypothetical protein
MSNALARHALVMRLTPGLLTFLIALLLCTTSKPASAQVTGHWDCRGITACADDMGAMIGDRNFATPKACDDWGAANSYRGSNLYTCTGGGGGGTHTLFVRGVSTSSALMQMGFLGGGVGAVGGSMAHHKNGESMIMEGTAAGIAGWGVMSMLANKSNRSAVGSLVVGTATGCAAGIAAGLYKDNDSKTVSTGVIADTAKVLKSAQIGCAAGFVSGGAMRALLNKLPAVRWLRRTSHPVSMINRGRNVGVLVAW